MKKNKHINQNGFTLVELLVVISLLMILAGVTMSILNPVRQRRVAEDSIRQANLEKYALGIEAYANAKGVYPASIVDSNNDNIPDDADVRSFIAKIPNDEPTTGVTYNYLANSSTYAAFGVYVDTTDTTDTACFKYSSEFGKIQKCTINDCTGGIDGANLYSAMCTTAQ